MIRVLRTLVLAVAVLVAAVAIRIVYTLRSSDPRRNDLYTNQIQLQEKREVRNWTRGTPMLPLESLGLATNLHREEFTKIWGKPPEQAQISEPGRSRVKFTYGRITNFYFLNDRLVSWNVTPGKIVTNVNWYGTMPLADVEELGLRSGATEPEVVRLWGRAHRTSRDYTSVLRKVSKSHGSSLIQLPPTTKLSYGRTNLYFEDDQLLGWNLSDRR